MELRRQRAGAEPGHPQAGIELLVERVQGRYRTLQDFQARFVQRRLTRFGSIVLEKTGRLFVRPPGKMRWEYEDPEQLFVTDGEEMYLYLSADNQVQVFKPESQEMARTPTMYLAGKGDFLHDFDAEQTDWGTQLAPGNVQVRLLPRSQDAPFSSLIMEIEPMQARVVRLVVLDQLNDNIEYQFHDEQVNVGFPDSLFEFHVPPGAEVVYIGG
ncbi:MAG: outer membrane lipoprotein carrier protein LolA [Acidobacteriota bacterium]